MPPASSDIAARAGAPAGPAQSWPDRYIEIAWLIGVLAVPVLFTPRRWLSFYNDPKYFVVHLVGLAIVMLWAYEWAEGARRTGRAWARSPFAWAGRMPGRWAVLAGLSLALAAVVSTIASPAPRVSLWGRDFIALGQELYTFLTLLAVFFAVSLRLRSAAQLSRLLLAIAVAGLVAGLYGTSQHLGWDPLGPGEDFARNFGSFGNPIFFGSFLVMASIATAGVALEGRRTRSRGLVVFAVLALGIELAALWATQSRGPLLGAGAGFAALLVIAGLALGRRTVLAAAAVLAGGLLIATPLSLLPEGDASEQARSLEDLGDIFDNEQATSIGGRADAWSGAFTLARTWERVPGEDDARRALRPVVGLGPDMYFYSYPLSIERDPSGTGLFFAHVHNFPMQLFLELGALGLASFLSVVLLVAYAAWTVLRAEKRGGRGGGPVAVFTAVIMAALAGRGVEQMSGVAHVSDLVTFWALAGALIALGELSARQSAPGPPAAPSPSPARSRPRRVAARPSAAVPVAIAGVVIVFGLIVFFVRDVRGIGASRVAAQGFDLIADGRSQEGLGKYERAVDLNPEVELYMLQVDFMIRAEADAREDPAQKVALNELSLAVLEEYEDRDPFAHATQRRIAKTEIALGRLGQAFRFESAVGRYTRLAHEMRSFPTIQALAGDGIVAAGDGVRDAGSDELAAAYYELGLSFAERAIALETEEHPDPRAWWVRGVAQERMGRMADALEFYSESVARAGGTIYESEAHSGLARVYEAFGEPARAGEHRRLAEETALAPG